MIIYLPLYSRGKSLQVINTDRAKFYGHYLEHGLGNGTIEFDGKVFSADWIFTDVKGVFAYWERNTREQINYELSKKDFEQIKWKKKIYWER